MIGLILNFRLDRVLRFCRAQMDLQIRHQQMNKNKKKKDKLLLYDYAREDIFNVDGTAFFHEILAEKSIAFNEDKCD